MMVWSINVLVLAIGFLIVGMIKPNWILFWMEKPARMPIVFLSVILFMASVVMFGEANNEKQLLNSKPTTEISQNKTEAVPTIVVETKKEN